MKLEPMFKSGCFTKVKTPATAATGAGAENTSSGRGTCEGGYLNSPSSATDIDIDSEAPQQVLAYVSRSFVYVVDQNLSVVAYGRLTRREVLE